MKDLGWVLLCAPVAWTAGLLAIFFQGQDLLQHWAFLSAAELVHSLASMSWICGSFVWMTAQLLFEPVIHKSRSSPWYGGAIVMANEYHYQMGTTLMQVIEGVALFGVLLFYIQELLGLFCTKFAEDSDRIRSWQPSHILTGMAPGAEARRLARRLAVGAEYDKAKQKLSSSSSGSASPERSDGAFPSTSALAGYDEDNELIFGFLTPTVYAKIFIVPWILKDLFWSVRWFIPTVLCLLMAIALMADYLWLSMKWKNAAALVWATGSAVWVCNDMVMEEQETWPLFLTLVLFTISCCMMARAILYARVNKSLSFACEDDHDPML